MTTVVHMAKVLEGHVRPIRPAAPPADLEGAVAALARREPAARDATPEVVLGGTAGPPMIEALRTKLAATGGSAAAGPTRARGTARHHAEVDPTAAATELATDGASSATAVALEAAAAPELDATVSVLLAAAIARAVGSIRSATGAISRPAGSASAPSASTAATPAMAATTTAATTSAGRGLKATALTPLEQAVHDLVERLSGNSPDSPV